MPSLAQLCVGALAVVLVTDYFAPPGSALSLRVQAGSSAPVTLYDVNRAGKGDRISAARSSVQSKDIATVEVVGLRNAAVVYRDEKGRVLFRVDPVSNATVISKNVVLPEVTIKENYRSPVRTLPVETNNTPSKPIPDGCDPAFSPLAVKANVTGRCVASRDVPTRMAALQ
jgi:hypothetical protein